MCWIHATSMANRVSRQNRDINEQYCQLDRQIRCELSAVCLMPLKIFETSFDSVK